MANNRISDEAFEALKAKGVKMTVTPLFADNKPPAGEDADAKDIASLYREACSSASQTVKYAWECGKRLTEKKASMEKGEWVSWLRTNYETLGFGESTARRFMDHYRKYPKQALTPVLPPQDCKKIISNLWSNEAREITKAPPPPEPDKPEYVVEPDYEAVPDEEKGDDAKTIWRRGIMNRAMMSEGYAQYEKSWKFESDDDMIDACLKASDAWIELAKFLEKLKKRSA